jgi:hypothetical protein
MQYLVNYHDLIDTMQRNNQSRIGFGIYFGQLENPSLSDFEPPLGTFSHYNISIYLLHFVSDTQCIHHRHKPLRGRASEPFGNEHICKCLHHLVKQIRHLIMTLVKTLIELIRLYPIQVMGTVMIPLKLIVKTVIASLLAVLPALVIQVILNQIQNQQQG